MLQALAQLKNAFLFQHSLSSSYHSISFLPFRGIITFSRFPPLIDCSGCCLLASVLLKLLLVRSPNNFLVFDTMGHFKNLYLFLLFGIGPFCGKKEKQKMKYFLGHLNFLISFMSSDHLDTMFPCFLTSHHHFLPLEFPG